MSVSFKTENQNVQSEKILKWRKSLTTMQDSQFFELIRIYLGEIHTPFNKDRLIEDLSAIFRKEQTKKNIISFLNDFDIKILSAIFALPDITQEKIIKFFSSDYNLSDIFTELYELSERLLIYSFKNEQTNEQNLAINPLLEETLKPYLNIQNLFEESECVIKNLDFCFELNDLFLAGFLCYIQNFPDICKNDFSIKKRDSERLEEIFKIKSKKFKLLLTSFTNLSILKLTEKGFFIDEEHLKRFCLLNQSEQYAFLAVSATIHLSRSNLQKNAQLFLDIIQTLGNKNYTKSSIIKIAFLLTNRQDEFSSKSKSSKFSQILQSHAENNFSNKDSNFSSTVIESIIDCAIQFGLLYFVGKDLDGNKLYSKNQRIFADSENQNSLQNFDLESSKKSEFSDENSKNKKGFVNINAGTNITILPGLSLNELLPFTSFLSILNYNTVSEFEITKKSISRAFDNSLTPDSIYEILQKYSIYELPQSLKMNIEDWYNSYSSANLYKGYVLKVDQKNARLIEKNPNIFKFVQTKLAENIYLLNIPFDCDAQDFIKTSGFDFIGNVKEAKICSEVLDYPVLHNGISIHFDKNNENSKDFFKPDFQNARKTKEHFNEILNSLELNEQQRSCLQNRINRNIIVSEEQLNAKTVKLEILEIDGMNYAGKIHLIEKAIDSGDSIELTLPFEQITGVAISNSFGFQNEQNLKFSKNSTFSKSETKNSIQKQKIDSSENLQNSNLVKILGKPLMVSKHLNDAIVRLQIVQTQEIRFFSISKVTSVRLVKTNLFGK